MSTRYCFELWQHDEFVASADSANQQDAEREIQHLAAVYGQDGPIEIRRYIRTELATEADATEAQLRTENAMLREDAERWAKEANNRDDLVCEVAQLRAALEPFTQFNSSEEFITVRLRTADITRAREALAQQTKEPSK